MLTLKKVSIHKYKCIESEQTFEVDNGITVLVGMNESGKTSILEALAKSNYFEDDPLFKFNPTHDYPRKEKKKIDKTGEFPYAIICVYEVSFVSLLRGNKLNIACMLDSSIDMSSKTKIDNLVREKIIQKQRILFYKDFLAGFDEADVEDLFEKVDYLKLFNAAFSELPDISIDNLDVGTKRMIVQLNKYLNVSRFNHYRPANQLLRLGVMADFFSETTIDNFENMFAKVNSLF